MKKALYLIALCFLITEVLMAQNIDDALLYNKRELTGSARSLAMANAFTALGGDLTSLSFNPAGIAVYRSSEFAFTPSISFNQSTASFDPFTEKDDKYSFPFNQIGGVTTSRSLREETKGIISTHFGFTYNRTADFNNKTTMKLLEGVKDQFDSNGNFTYANTLLSNILLEANGSNLQDMSHRAYWAYKSDLLRPLFPDLDPNDNTEYYSQYDYLDEANSTYYNRNTNGVTQKYLIEESGYAGEYSFVFGANISNVLMLGASVDIHSFKYERKNSFREVNTNSFDPAFSDDLDYYDLYTRIKQDGFGLSGKVGAILNLNPIRLGVSFHLPTYYEIDKEEYDGINSYFLDYTSAGQKSEYIFDYSYNYRTPYRLETGAAFVLGKYALISFDYEMIDHTSAKYSSKDGFDESFRNLNKEIEDVFQVTHNFRAGVEVKPLPYIAIRAGAAYFDSPFKDDYTIVKMDKWMTTAGLGIRNKNFFFDIAYSLMYYKDSYNINADADNLNHPLLDPLYFTGIELENKNHQASFTFGWKF